MIQPTDNAAYLRQWASDIRKHSGKSVDADRCDAIGDEIERLRAEVKKLQGELEQANHAVSFAGSDLCKQAIGEITRIEMDRLRALNAELIHFVEKIAHARAPLNDSVYRNARAILAKAKEQA